MPRLPRVTSTDCILVRVSSLRPARSSAFASSLRWMPRTCSTSDSLGVHVVSPRGPLTTQRVGTMGTWSSALIYGANDQIGPGPLASSVVLESTLDLDGMNSFFGRAEYVQKSAEELVIPSVPASAEYAVGALALGYLRTIGTMEGMSAAAGVRGSVNLIPASLEAAYGSRVPKGVAIYLRLRPAASVDTSM